MKKNTTGPIRDLTEIPVTGGLLSFSLPLIVTNLLQILFNVADIAVVGRFAGSRALGAVGSTSTLVVLITGFLIGIGSGVNVLTAQAIGKGQTLEGTKQDPYRSLRRTVHTAFLLSAVISLLVLACSEAATTPVLRLLKTKATLLDPAATYLHIYFLGIPALMLFNYGNAVFSAAGDTRRPLIYLTASGILNVILNLLFVIHFRMDCAGVALATIISQYLSALLIVAALFRVQGPHRLRLADMHMDSRKARRLLAVGLPAGFQNAIFQIANLFVQFGVNHFDAVVVAGNAAAQNADALVYDTMAAFYTACGSFIGQNFGAGRKDRVKEIFRTSTWMAFAAGLGIGLSLVAFRRPFLSLFTRDPDVLAQGMYRLTVMGFSYAFSALMDNSIAASRAIGYGVVPTIIVILGSCVFRVIWIFTVFMYFRTITSIYLLYIFSWSLTGIAEYLYFRRKLSMV